MQGSHAINWFEIPVSDINRATRFYETVLDSTLKSEVMEGAKLSIFSYGSEHVGGCLIQDPKYLPSKQGTVPYLNAGASLDAVLARVARAGGEVALAKTALPEGMGFYAHIVDTEGNRVGLHAMQ